MTVDLPDDALARLRAEAARRGLSADEMTAEFAEQLPSDEPASSRRTLAFVGAGVSRSGITTRMDQTRSDGFGRD